MQNSIETLRRVTIDDWSKPYKTNYGRDDGVTIPLTGIGLDFTDAKDSGRRHAVFLRVGAGPFEIAEALEQLAAELRTGKGGARNDETLTGRECNRGQYSDILTELTITAPFDVALQSA